MKKPVTIVILAAGLGTRMKSRQAKVLHQAGGKTLLQHVMDTALSLAPPERIFAVIGHQAEQVRQSAARSGIGFIEQTDQKGTGHAVMIGRDSMAHLDGYLMVLYGDSPLLSAETLRRLIAQEMRRLRRRRPDERHNGRSHGLRPRDSRFSRTSSRCGGAEGRNPEQLAIREANMGIYCFRADLFWKHIDEVQPRQSRRGEYYLTDMVGHPDPCGSHRGGHADR